MRIFLVGLLGLAGVFSRYAVGLAVSRILPGPYPYATFSINIVGAFLIGVVYVLGVERAVISPDLRVALMVGFMGGFTTFSAYCLEFAHLIEDMKYWYAALYFGLSNLCGFMATVAGLALTRILIKELT